jgi:hypothetical protein
MAFKSLVEVCIIRICEDIGSHSGIINSLWNEVPITLLDKIRKHHSNNCIDVEVEYVEIVPAYQNGYR